MFSTIFTSLQDGDANVYFITGSKLEKIDLHLLPKEELKPENSKSPCMINKSYIIKLNIAEQYYNLRL